MVGVWPSMRLPSRAELDALLAAPAQPSAIAGIPPEGIETLIAKWRAFANVMDKHAEEGAAAMRICADDLAALLSTAPPSAIGKLRDYTY